MLIGISDQMGTRFDRLRCEVFQNLILSPMNTGLLRPAVATVLTVYGIETKVIATQFLNNCLALQQCLPFTVLKLSIISALATHASKVATVLTVYGIETQLLARAMWERLQVATVLTVYGIETKS